MPRSPSCGTSAENRALVVCCCNPTQWRGAQIKGCGAARPLCGHIRKQWATTKTTTAGTAGPQFTALERFRNTTSRLDFFQNLCLNQSEHDALYLLQSKMITEYKYEQYTYNPEWSCLLDAVHHDYFDILSVFCSFYPLFKMFLIQIKCFYTAVLCLFIFKESTCLFHLWSFFYEHGV